MDNETYKQIVLSYIPYGVQVQYEGILNGKEKTDYRKDYDAKCKKIDTNNGSYKDYPEYNMPEDIIGLKLGLIKRVSFWKNYINLDIGIKSEGLKRFALNLNAERKFKLVLHPLSDLSKEIEYNNKKFIPLVELLKTKHNNWYKKYNGTRYGEIRFNEKKAWFEYQATLEVTVNLYGGYDLFCFPEYWIMEKLFKWKFDVFGFIEKGLAVDINTLNKEICR